VFEKREETKKADSDHRGQLLKREKGKGERTSKDHQKQTRPSQRKKERWAGGRPKRKERYPHSEKKKIGQSRAQPRGETKKRQNAKAGKEKPLKKTSLTISEGASIRESQKIGECLLRKRGRGGGD